VSAEATAGHRPTHCPAVSPIHFLDDLEAPAWMSQGLCAQTDPEAWFPEKGGSTRAAKQICLSCDVRDECLAYAIEHGERFGIWGGLSERERLRLVLADGAAPRPCRRSDCTETIRVTAHASKKYHNAECATRARDDFIISGLDHEQIVAAYAACGAVTAIAKQQQVPIRVISRILDERGVVHAHRRPRTEAS
jgi:WhiB family redox-sensing transcriptional regulator